MATTPDAGQEVFAMASTGDFPAVFQFGLGGIERRGVDDGLVITGQQFGLPGFGPRGAC